MAKKTQKAMLYMQWGRIRENVDQQFLKSTEKLQQNLLKRLKKKDAVLACPPIEYHQDYAARVSADIEKRPWAFDWEHYMALAPESDEHRKV